MSYIATLSSAALTTSKWGHGWNFDAWLAALALVTASILLASHAASADAGGFQRGIGVQVARA